MVLLYAQFCCVCIFFFKQKTAYEMRISDWSSDVCSDLPAVEGGIVEIVGDEADVEVQVEQRTDLGVDAEERAGSHRIAVVARRVVLIEVAPPHEGLHQIGRASCRERVCQYV